MKAFEAGSEIQASPEAIWALLTDAAGLSTWDSGIERVDGSITPGETIRVVSRVNPGRVFPVRVSEFLPGRSMTWSGGMPLGLFRGVRTFTLTPDGSGTTRFHMREQYSGPLVPLMARSIPDLGPSFEQFARGLKARAERA